MILISAWWLPITYLFGAASIVLLFILGHHEDLEGTEEERMADFDLYSYDQKWMNRNAPLNEQELGN